MRHLLPFLLVALLSTLAHAAGPPQQPFLVIDPGMHTGVVRSISVSADGTLVATASQDKTARLWSVAERRLLRTFRLPMLDGSGGMAYAVALSPDGRLLAAGGLDADEELNHQGGYVYVFDAINGKLLHRLGPVPQAIGELEFSPDGQRLAAGLGQGGGLLLWPAPFTGKSYHATDFSASITEVKFDGDGTLYALSDDGVMSIYGPPLTPVRRFNLPDGAIAGSIAVSGDSKRMAIGYVDRAGIDIVSLPQFELAHSVVLNFVTRGNLGMVAWSADGETLFASGTFFDADSDPFQHFAFPDKGKGKPVAMGSSMANVLDMINLPKANVVFSTGLPSLGALPPGGFFFPPVQANMANKLRENFTLSRDGRGVRFGLGEGGTDPWIFDAGALTFKSSPQGAPGYLQPDTTSLPLSEWEDSASPRLGESRRIRLLESDRSHAVAVFPDAKSFVIGTTFDLIRLDPEGGVFWSADTHGTCWGVNVSGDGDLVTGAFDDGTIRWYRASDGRELLAVFVHVPSKRWIAWTPSGYYAASPGAEELIGWHVNGKTWDQAPQFYPASRFRDRFYRPDVVQQVLALKDEAKALAAADANASRKPEDGDISALLPASVELLLESRSIAAKTREITIPYRLASPTGREVTRVDVRVDGRPVSARGASQAESEFPLGEELNVTIKLPQRDAEVSLIAFIGDQPGPAATIPVTWEGGGDGARPHQLHALLVGVSAYDNPDMRLAYAAKDAEDIAAKLMAQEGVFYEKVNIEILLDSAANKSAIEKQLALLKKRAGPEDTVLVFFAGHGMTSTAFDFYYLAADSEMDADLLEATAVDGRLIRKILGGLPGRVVLMMDTCRSGAGIEGAVDMTRAANDMAQDTAGIVMFASSQGREDSLESKDWENGAFTEALLSIIDDPKVYGDDSRLSIPELEEAVTVRVAELTEGRQSAGMTKYGSTPRFFIAGMK